MTAFIKSISVFGEMEIEFNGTMSKDYNFSQVNTSLVDMFIDPSGRLEDYNMSLVNFTWELINRTTYH